MIHVVIGAPCSGKSTYVKAHRQDDDIVVDFDRLAEAFGSKSSHSAPDQIKAVTFKARQAAIEEICQGGYEAWIIHTSPSEKQKELYEAAGAEYIEMETDIDTCLARAEADGRPEGTADVIRAFFNAKKGTKKMVKTKAFDVKADNGIITGYASTWIREPDSYGDVVAKGAFAECIEKLKADNKILPLLYNHDNEELKNFIGSVYAFEEDDHGLKFEATFDATPEAQRARELAMDGRLAKFSFAYDVIDQAAVTLEDGREANELRKLNIHEVSLVLYPANPDTSIVSIKSGRRNSAKDAEDLRKAITLIQGVLGELDDIPAEEETEAKSEEPGTANDEELKRSELLEKAKNILNGRNE